MALRWKLFWGVWWGIYSLWVRPVFAQPGPEVRVIPPVVQVEVGETADITIEVRRVQNLYAADIWMAFDPAVIEVQDADPDQAGVQVAIEDFLDVGYVLQNQVDPVAGTIRLTITQLNPSPPKQGRGPLFSLRVRGRRAGMHTPLELREIRLADVDGFEIGATLFSGAVDVVAAPGNEPTEPPTQAPVPTPTPTPLPLATPTPSPVPTATPRPAASPTSPPPTETLTFTPTSSVTITLPPAEPPSSTPAPQSPTPQMPAEEPPAPTKETGQLSITPSPTLVSGVTRPTPTPGLITPTSPVPSPPPQLDEAALEAVPPGQSRRERVGILALALVLVAVVFGVLARIKPRV